MNAKELRIGNYVQDVEEIEKMLPVYGIESNYIRCGDSAYSYPYLPEHLKGIPLTPKLLEKCGFENTGMYENEKRVSDCWAMPYKRQIEDESRQRIFIVPYPLTEIKYAFSVENAENDFRIAIAAIQYLHQLQNLYYALTNTDLTINL